MEALYVFRSNKDYDMIDQMVRQICLKLQSDLTGVNTDSML